MCSPNRNMRIICCDYVNIPIKSCTGIPAGALFRVLKSHGKHIILTVTIQKISYIEMKSVVAIRPVTGFIAIYVNPGIAHCTIELNCYPLIIIKFRNSKIDTIPACTCKRQTARSSVMFNSGGLSVLHYRHAMNIIILIKRTVNCPIVWHTHRLPITVVVSYTS